MARCSNPWAYWGHSHSEFVVKVIVVVHESEGLASHLPGDGKTQDAEGSSGEERRSWFSVGHTASELGCSPSAVALGGRVDGGREGAEEASERGCAS